MIYALLSVVCLFGSTEAVFSWDTLPVYFHSQNYSGQWNAEATKQIARFPLATMEKAHATADGTSLSYKNTCSNR